MHNRITGREVALAAIIVMAGVSLCNFKEVSRTWRTRPASAYYSLATTAAVLVAGLMIGRSTPGRSYKIY
jgi:MFS superfamily sulfate permease-like transporter